MNQYKIPYPKHSTHKTHMIGNNPIDYLEYLMENIHAAQSSLPPRSIIKPNPNHAIGKMHMHVTAASHLYRTKAQFKRWFKVENTNT